MTFTGSVHIKQHGHATLHLDKYNEDYIQTLPSITVKSLLTGSPYPELEGPVFIYSSSGLTCRIEFEDKTHLMGLVGSREKNTVHATVYKSDAPEDVLFEVSGEWSGTLEIKDVRSGKVLETFDTTVLTPQPMSVAPLDAQDPWESRRAWAGVIQALKDGDMAKTAEEKGKIEKAQREMRKVEQKEGKGWETRFFVRDENDELFQRVVGAQQEMERDLTGGVWKFDMRRWEGAQRPFRGELTPLGGTVSGSGNEGVVNGAR